MANVDVRVRLSGSERIRAALNGVQRDQRRAQQQARDESKKTKDQVSKDEKLKTDEVRRHAKIRAEIEAAAQRAIRAEGRAAVREVERSQKAKERAQRLARQQDARLHGQRMGGLSSGMGTALGVGLGGMSIASLISQLNSGLNEISSALRGRAGMQDLGSTIATGLDLNEASMRVANQAFANATPEEYAAGLREMRQNVASVARATNVEPGRLIEGLRIFQDEFSAYDFGLANLTELARNAQAAGLDISDMARAMGEAREQFRLTNEQGRDFFGVLQEQGRMGKIQPAQFASTFAPMMGQYIGATERRGDEGFREFGAMVQLMAKGGGTAETVSTRVSEALRVMSDPGTLRRLQQQTRGRTSFRNRDGTVRTMDQIIDDMLRPIAQGGFVNARGALDARAMSRVFSDSQARQGWSTLLQKTLEARAGLHGDDWGGRDPIEALMGVDAGLGNRSLDRAAGRVLSTEGARQRAIGIDRTLRVANQAEDRARQATPGIAFQDALETSSPNNLQSTLRGMMGDTVSGLAFAALEAIQRGAATDKNLSDSERRAAGQGQLDTIFDLLESSGGIFGGAGVREAFTQTQRQVHGAPGGVVEVRIVNGDELARSNGREIGAEVGRHIPKQLKPGSPAAAPNADRRQGVR